MMTNRLTRLAVAVVVTVTTIGLTADDRPVDRSATASKPSSGTIEVSLCQIKFHRRAELATDRPGIIAEMPFDEGDAVAEGNLVVRLRDEVALANLKLATERAASNTAVEIAEKEAEAAALDLQVYEEGNTRVPGLHAKTLVDRARLVLQAREKAVLRAREEVSLNRRAVEQAQAEVDSLRVFSKQSGMVTRVLKREGEAVQQGEGVIEVVDPTIARVEGRLHVADARRLRLGMPVQVRLDFRDVDLPIEQEVFEGKIGFIDVFASSSQHEVRIWAEVRNRDGILLDNLPALMTIDVGEPTSTP
jgi:multidrug resistance efflux pump